MSERIEKAFKELVDAVNDEATSKVTEIKTIVEPIVTQAVAQVTAAVVASRFKFSDLFKDLKEGVTPEAEKADPNVDAKSNDGGAFADPLPTPAQNDAIRTLRTLGKTDEEIAFAVGVSVRTVKMAI